MNNNSNHNKDYDDMDSSFSEDPPPPPKDNTRRRERKAHKHKRDNKHRREKDKKRRKNKKYKRTNKMNKSRRGAIKPRGDDTQSDNQYSDSSDSSSSSSSSNSDASSSDAPSEEVRDIAFKTNEESLKIARKEMKKLKKDLSSECNGQMAYLCKVFASSDPGRAPLIQQAMLYRAKSKNTTLRQVYRDPSLLKPDIPLIQNLLLSIYDANINNAKRLNKPEIVKKLKEEQGQVAIMIIRDGFLFEAGAYYATAEAHLTSDCRIENFLDHYKQSRKCNLQMSSNIARSAKYGALECTAYNAGYCGNPKCGGLHACMNPQHVGNNWHPLVSCPLIKSKPRSYLQGYRKNRRRSRGYNRRRNFNGYQNQFKKGYNNKEDGYNPNNNKDRYFKR